MSTSLLLSKSMRTILVSSCGSHSKGDWSERLRNPLEGVNSLLFQETLREMAISIVWHSPSVLNTFMRLLCTSKAASMVAAGNHWRYFWRIQQPHENVREVRGVCTTYASQLTSKYLVVGRGFCAVAIIKRTGSTSKRLIYAWCIERLFSFPESKHHCANVCQ